MQIGIGGLPRAGKTTVFNALAHQRAQTGGYAGAEPNLASLRVPDERLDRLSALFQPKKHTPAELRFLDVAGVAKGAAGSDSSAAILAHLRTVDVLVQVIAAHQEERDPRGDYEEFSLELQLADLGQVERRLDRLDRELRLGGKGTPQERAAREREQAALQKILPGLDGGQPVRSIDLSKDEQRVLTNFGFLTQKPTLVLLNTGDEQDPAATVERLADLGQIRGTAVLALPGKLEMELGELPPTEAAEFREALGVERSRLGDVIRQAYDLAERISFFTAGEDECRAWTIGRGTPAQEAAGAIHSDLQRGFIRAEVIGWEQLLEAGSEAAAKKRGWVRQEGKGYVVQDGDVLHVLFNI